MLFRAHYEVINVLGMLDDGFCYNLSNYPVLNDLIIISDLLISDYSGVYFEFSITGKPMLNFAYDLELYEKYRGLYLDLHEVMPGRVNKTEDELLDEILSMEVDEYSARTLAFK